METKKTVRTGIGPFIADQLRSGDSYELSRGHAIYCLPTAGRGSKANLLGGSVLETDPAVESAGVDTGFAPEPGTLRAPDVAVGNVPDEPGWVRGCPPLAVEYADRGTDEEDLQQKIEDLLRAGTRHIWVVRLTGPRRVEIHEPGVPVRLAHPEDQLVAPGILQNPVSVLSLYERDAAHEAVLRNLLQRQGYSGLDEVRAEGKAEGKAEGFAEGLANAVLRLLEGRGVGVDAAVRATILACRDTEVLNRWLLHASTASSASDVVRG